MKNLNPYYEDSFKQWFKTTDTFLQLEKKYHDIFFDKFLEPRFERISTGRQQLSYSWVSTVPWYYLNYLNTDCEIVDLGCGFNFFKPYFPNLIGISAEDASDQFFGDAHDFVDDVFYQGHKNTYESVFSINALHFHPLESLRNICINFADMLKSGGRGFLAMNAQRMIERSPTMGSISNNDLDSWIRSQFEDFPNKIIVFDVDLSQRNAWLDGNIRIVFEK